VPETKTKNLIANQNFFAGVAVSIIWVAGNGSGVQHFKFVKKESKFPFANF
jgi:hypothetical protein